MPSDVSERSVVRRGRYELATSARLDSSFPLNHLLLTLDLLSNHNLKSNIPEDYLQDELQDEAQTRSDLTWIG